MRKGMITYDKLMELDLLDVARMCDDIACAHDNEQLARENARSDFGK